MIIIKIIAAILGAILGLVCLLILSSVAVLIFFIVRDEVREHRRWKDMPGDERQRARQMAWERENAWRYNERW
jgi:hypothetical protein